MTSETRPGDSLVVRAPNHLGDFVMSLPALRAAQPSAVVVKRWLAPLAEMVGFATIPFDRDIKSVSSAALSLRRFRFRRGILFTPSFSSALMLRVGNVPSRRGADTDRRGLLLTERVDRKLLDQYHRAAAYMLLATGEVPADTPIPALTLPTQLRADFRELIGTNAPLIGICPGSHAPSRTWYTDRFAEVVRQIATDATVVVFGSSAEANITRMVAGDVAIDLAGKTDLPLLAAGLAECSLVITNDSGPLHLAAAVGTPTVSVWGAGDPSRTGPPVGHTILRDTKLPCLECVKNVCPRDGKGFFLPQAYMECMQLIRPQDVLTSIRAQRNAV